MNLFFKQTQRHRKQTYGYLKGVKLGVHKIRSSGLLDTNYYINNNQQGPAE